MVDVEALLSPSGGYGYENTINTGIAGIAGLAVDTGLFKKYVGIPALRSEKERQFKARPALRNEVKEYKIGVDRVLGKESARRASYFPSKINEQSRSLRVDKVVGGIETKNKALRDYIGTQRDSSRALRKGIRSDAKFIRGAAWTMMLSFGLEVAEQAFTPGISKVAAKRDDEMLSNQNAADSPAAYTMRQRAVMAIHDSLMNVRQVIGNEANFMHR